MDEETKKQLDKYQLEAIEAIEAMMPGFRKLLKILIKGKRNVAYLEGFFDGMITMKKIELGMIEDE